MCKALKLLRQVQWEGVQLGPITFVGIIQTGCKCVWAVLVDNAWAWKMFQKQSRSVFKWSYGLWIALVLEHLKCGQKVDKNWKYYFQKCNQCVEYQPKSMTSMRFLFASASVLILSPLPNGRQNALFTQEAQSPKSTPITLRVTNIGKYIYSYFTKLVIMPLSMIKSLHF